MSSLSIPRPKKMSDGHFIGDLTKLLERRKIRCGDPVSLDTFGAELSSNNILRSDLFTLCTAISHMGEEDLTGEELLVLVGRAVGGPQVCRGEGSVEIPDSMRSPFLSGYDAWSKRGTEISEPLPWPPPRPQLARSEPVPAVVEEEPKRASEEGTVKAPVAGMRTLQEALEIAKERSPSGLVPQREPVPSVNIEGLTISELKALLEDIEHRVSRIQPHLNQLNSAADLAGDLRRTKQAAESEDVIPFPAPRSAEPATPLAVRPPASPADSVAAIEGKEDSAPRRSPMVDVSDDAFLARHPYMRPSKRKVPDLPISVLPASAIDAPRAVAPAPIPAAVVEPKAPSDPFIPEGAEPQAVPDVAQQGPPIAARVPGETVSMTPATVSQAVAIRTAIRREVGHHRAEAPVVQLNPIAAAVVYVLQSLRVSRAMLLAIVAVMALVPMAFAGAFLYDYLFPKVVIRYPDPEPPAASSVPADPLAGGAQDTAGTTPNVAATPEVVPASSPARVVAKPQPAIEHSATSRGTQQAPVISKPSTQAYVWPPPPGGAGSTETSTSTHPLVAAATSTLTTSSAARPNHMTGPPASAIYVPSSTMIKYAVSAPKPVYPPNKSGLEGTVVVQITVSKQGDVTSARTVSGPIEFRAAAMQAVRNWRFRPYMFNGSPADVETTLELPFAP